MTTHRNISPVETHPEETLAGLVALAQEAFSAEQPGAGEAGLVRFERSVAQRTLRRRSPGLRLVLGVGIAAAAAAISLVTLRDHGSALTFSVVNGTVSNGGYVRANVSGGTALHFSDGSSLSLDPGTGARVGDLDARGGRVLLESGRARVHVNPRPRANWTVDAGPYSVHVVGTEFDIRWSVSEEVLELHLLKGAIVVRGPLARHGISMEGGAHLFANVRKGEIRLDGQQAPAGLGEGAAAVAGAREPAAPGEPISRETPASAALGRTHAAHPSSGAFAARPRPGAGARQLSMLETGWSARLAHGDFQGVLADAERRGLDSVLATGSPTDLTALADAARFARRGKTARAALLAERERFPRSPQARDAAFFLGGLSEDEPGETALKTALDWYDSYLRESPNGAFVRPVWGRRMVLIQKLRGTEAARPLAVEYLARFSDGPYAGSARRLLEAR
jgi:hypothetical protein